jgi:apolipoprotein N-acyltransferase
LEEGRYLRFALVQRNFPCVFKENSENPIAAYDKLFETVSHTRPDIVVLSESALAEFGDSVDSMTAHRFAAHAMRKTGAKAVLAGGSRREKGKTYNSAALYVDGEGGKAEIAGVYDKVHLVPFGEYIPFDKTFKCLQSLAPVGSCYAGEPKLLDFHGTKIAVAICYEDTDAALVSRFADMGADVLVFITNDSWFSESNEAVAHSWHATARAVETGLPVVRVGNSGVTASIQPDGKVQTLSDNDGFPLVDEPGCFSVAVCIKPQARTPYVICGDMPLAVAFALVLACVCLSPVRRTRLFSRG